MASTKQKSNSILLKLTIFSVTFSTPEEYEAIVEFWPEDKKQFIYNLTHGVGIAGGQLLSIPAARDKIVRFEKAFLES